MSTMRIRTVTFASLVCICVAFLSILSIESVLAQAPARGGAQAPAPAPARGRGAAPAARYQVHGNLLQVMRGILFPNSNVVFSAQTVDPATVKKAADPTVATDALTGVYGGWEAIENSGIAMAEAANLLQIPGRVCSNGKPVPVQNADWQMFVQGLRAAGMATYKAGQSKNMDAVVEVSDTVATACMNCHDVYREKTPAQGGLAARCTK
jgi:hypothetical protein